MRLSARPFVYLRELLSAYNTFCFVCWFYPGLEPCTRGTGITKVKPQITHLQGSTSNSPRQRQTYDDLRAIGASTASILMLPADITQQSFCAFACVARSAISSRPFGSSGGQMPPTPRAESRTGSTWEYTLCCVLSDYQIYTWLAGHLW